jgi:hypothetical protein
MHERRVRIIKREQRIAAAESESAGGAVRCAGRTAREVVSEWVREHSRRTEEYRQAYASLLKELGFR